MKIQRIPYILVTGLIFLSYLQGISQPPPTPSSQPQQSPANADSQKPPVSTVTGTNAEPVTPKKRTTMTFVRKEIKIDKFYTKEELNVMPKLELRDVYKSRLVYIIEVLPFISLHPEPGATLFDMGIPETDVNLKHLEKEMRNKQVFLNSMFQTLDDVIPYSDKANIVWAILYFDDIIKKSNYASQAPPTKGK